MAKAVGIDLGTTNSVIAPVEGGSRQGRRAGGACG
jgi:molecular chaperone DnaK (HSP70)